VAGWDFAARQRRGRRRAVSQRRTGLGSTAIRLPARLPPRCGWPEERPLYTSRTLHVHFTYTSRALHVHLTYPTKKKVRWSLALVGDNMDVRGRLSEVDAHLKAETQYRNMWTGYGVVGR